MSLNEFEYTEKLSDNIIGYGFIFSTETLSRAFRDYLEVGAPVTQW